MAPTTIVNWDFQFSKAQISGICAELLLYGILIVLVCTAAYLLYHWTGPGRKVLVAATMAMTIFATAEVVLQIYGTFLGLQIVRYGIEGELAAAAETTKEYQRVFTAELFLLFTNNLVTDGLFIYRCFAIWGRDVRIVVLPTLLLFATAVVGYLATYYGADVVNLNHIDARIPIAMTFATNVLLMVLTAGRIWWVRRDACVLESAHVQKYNTAIAMILESGALYCLTILLYLILYSITSPNTNTSPATAISETSVIQIMNIAPMLLIVRVGLRRVAEGNTTDHGQEARPCTRAIVADAASTRRVTRTNASSIVFDISTRGDERGAVISMADFRK
ncbi:hypothetical protein DFH06DRAFT_613993 [Mycena polygramma]|nr:hypothetical protein DFH06DRAFT_613993 [Mycena polygramma]